MTFLFVSLSYTAESAIVTAFITFIPKFIESQFGIPASNASIYTGKALPLGLLASMAVVSVGRSGGRGDGLSHTQVLTRALLVPAAPKLVMGCAFFDSDCVHAIYSLPVF